MTATYDFAAYVADKKKADQAVDPHGYAYSGDLRVLETMKALGPIELAVASVVRLWKSLMKNELLGSAVKVTPAQFPRIDAIGRDCAKMLGIDPPQIYVVQSLGSLNAMTYGTNEDAYVLLHSAVVDHMDDVELRFIVGHECGHIQNNHVVYSTALHYLTNVAGVLVRGIGTPAILALKAWSRRAELTCDRAGLLCCRDLGAATRALVKFAVGSQKLYEQVDVEEYLKQLAEGKDGVGKFAELFRTHPYLPKRVQALRWFGDSEPYRRLAGMGEGGTSKEDLDAKVGELVSVVTS